MAKGEGEEGGEKGHTYVAFDFWSGFVLRVLVDVGDDFVTAGAWSCWERLVVREERG